MNYPQIKPRIWTDDILYSVIHRLMEKHNRERWNKASEYIKDNTPLFFHKGKLYNAKGEEVNYQ